MGRAGGALTAVCKAGFGRQGYCKLCSFKDELELNNRLAQDWNARQINDWLKTHYDFTVDRATVYRHKREHIGHPEDRLVTAVEKSKAIEPTRRKRATSNEQFLEAVRDIGFQRAVDNPDEVTIDQSLKATQILMQSKGGDRNALLILAIAMTGGQQPYEVIEGEYEEVEATA